MYNLLYITQLSSLHTASIDTVTIQIHQVILELLQCIQDFPELHNGSKVILLDEGHSQLFNPTKNSLSLFYYLYQLTLSVSLMSLCDMKFTE